MAVGADGKPYRNGDVFVNVSPATLVGVSARRTVMSTMTCSPMGMSMPLPGSSMTRFVAVPVFCGIQLPDPETF